MKLDVAVRCPTSRSARARQLEGMFDVPSADEAHREWHGDAPLDERPWSVGLIVGPSGAGKSTLAATMFDVAPPLEWGTVSVLDDFDRDVSIDDVSKACQAVGFNTIPAWLRPHGVLSTGERFRVELARRLVESPADRVLCVDEFTSVVDRQVAQIGSFAVAKWARKNERRFVAVSCHYDIVDWLQPDWVLEPATMTFAWRSVQPRPSLDVTICQVPYSAWQLFAPFHYLTAELNKAARCYVLFVGDEPTAFAGVLHRPHSKVNDIKGISRLVTLPDWQGLGLAFVLADKLGAAHRALGQRLHTYPAHPALIASFDRSRLWAMTTKPTQGLGIVRGKSSSLSWTYGVRPNAVFEYAGPKLDHALAERLLNRGDPCGGSKSKAGSMKTTARRTKRRLT